MDVNNVQTLEEILNTASSDKFPNPMEKTHIKRYEELKAKFSAYKVEDGAMAQSIVEWLAKAQAEVEEINKLPDENDRNQRFSSLFAEDPIVYLNRHDASHIAMVQSKALNILQCFTNVELTPYEVYILLCASVVHDIGNITGRKGHEKKIRHILDTECASILPDSIERTVISRIARAHGGGTVDTISYLEDRTLVYNFPVRERILAAILRFADELADDYTRADHSGLKNDVISSASKIYHMYSSCLHTVDLSKNQVNDSYEVTLAFSFDTDIACTLYGAPGRKKYLLDEIYDRTIKMERERRYCIRYLRPYCQLERIKVEIRITDTQDEFITYKINYTLEEKGYPAIPYTTIKDVDDRLSTGAEWCTKLSKAGEAT